MILPEDSPAVEREKDAGRPDERGIGALFPPLVDAVRQAWTLVQVHVDRARAVRARARERALERIGGHVLRGILILAGGLLAALGVRGGLHELFAGRPWLAELTMGALLLGTASLWARAARAREERTERGRLAHKYASALEGLDEHGNGDGRANGAPGTRAGAGTGPARA